MGRTRVSRKLAAFGPLQGRPKRTRGQPSTARFIIKEKKGITKSMENEYEYESHESFPAVTMSFILILFISAAVPLFGVQTGLAIMCALLFVSLVLGIAVPFMAFFGKDLPCVIIPVTIFLSSIGIPILMKGEAEMVQIDLSNATAIAILAGAGGAVVTTCTGLYKIWRDSKAIKEIKKNVNKVDVHIGETKSEVVSVRGKEISTIEAHTRGIHENMLSRVLPGMEQLDRISGFVTKIDINTQNSGGDTKLIFSEVTKMAERIEFLKSELESEKRETREREQRAREIERGAREREQRYMEQLAVLRTENDRLLEQNRRLELALGQAPQRGAFPGADPALGQTPGPPQGQRPLETLDRGCQRVDPSWEREDERPVRADLGEIPTESRLDMER